MVEPRRGLGRGTGQRRRNLSGPLISIRRVARGRVERTGGLIIKRGVHQPVKLGAKSILQLGCGVSLSLSPFCTSILEPDLHVQRERERS